MSDALRLVEQTGETLESVLHYCFHNSRSEREAVLVYGIGEYFTRYNRLSDKQATCLISIYKQLRTEPPKVWLSKEEIQSLFGNLKV